MTEPEMTSRDLMLRWLNENIDHGRGGASAEEVMQNIEASSWLAERERAFRQHIEALMRDASMRNRMLDTSDAFIEHQKQELTTLRANVDPFDMIKKLGAAYQALQEYAAVLGDRP